MIKNLPSNAGDTGSVSGQGTEIPHQGDLVHATTRESSHAPRRMHTHTNGDFQEGRMGNGILVASREKTWGPGQRHFLSRYIFLSCPA